MQLKVLNAATATNGVPTADTDGFEMGRNNNNTPVGIVSFLLASVAGTDTLTCLLKLWVRSRVSGTWMPHGTHPTDAKRGLLNQGNAIGELAAPADSLDHTELIGGLQNYDRAYIEIVTIGGTDTALSAWLVERSQ